MYLTVKLIHTISATLLFGTGPGSAVYLFMAYRSGNMQVMAETDPIGQSKTLKAFFTTEAQKAQRKNFIVSCACGAANNKS